MQIKDLPSTSSVASTDVLAKDTSGGTTNKVAISDFVVNNLTSTSTTKPLSAAQGRALNNAKANIYKYSGAICSSSTTSSGDVFSYFPDIANGTYLVILYRSGYAWDDAASIYIAQHGSTSSTYGKFTIKEGSNANCPKMNSSGKVTLPAVSDYVITITLVKLN